MNKLKTIAFYECATSVKYVLYFYCIQYGFVAVIATILAVTIGLEDVTFNGQETSSVIFLAIVGCMGMGDDFKTLLQNGFTRKYIFAGTVSLIIFLALALSSCDLLISRLMPLFFNESSSLFEQIYGTDSAVANWLWSLALYFMIGFVCYFFRLLAHRLGKNGFIILGIVLIAVSILLAIYSYAIPDGIINAVNTFWARALGFVGGGRVNPYLPALTFTIISAVLAGGSYVAIRGAELK